MSETSARPTYDVAAGLATYLGEAWGQDVHVGNLSTTTAGARRHNVLFDAEAGGAVHHLVATIVPFGETIINPIDAEAGVRDLAEKAGVVVPHVHLVRTDGDLVGGPFLVSEFVPGETVPRRVLRLVAETGVGELVVTQIGESLARLHAIDPSDVTVPLRVREFAGPPAVAALAGMRAAVDELPQRRPVLELGLRWLERRLPDPPARETIVHSDVRNGNLIIGDDGLRRRARLGGDAGVGRPDAGPRVAVVAHVALPQRHRRDRWVRRPGALHRRLRVGRRHVRRRALPLVEGRGNAAMGRRPGRPDDGLPRGPRPQHRDGRQRPPRLGAGVGPAHAHPAVTDRF